MIMAKEEKSLPETMIAPETGALLSRSIGLCSPLTPVPRTKASPLNCQALSAEGGEYVSVVRAARTSGSSTVTVHTLRKSSTAPASPATEQRDRRKLKLSQRKAGELLKVGENAFDKYERGLVEPSRADGSVDHGAGCGIPEIIEELRVKI